MESDTIGPVPDKSLLFGALEFLCQVICEPVWILTCCNPQLWTGEFVVNGWNSMIEVYVVRPIPNTKSSHNSKICNTCHLHNI